MKKLIFTLLLFSFFGCATVPCPPEDIYYIITFADGEPKITYMEKGQIDDRKFYKSEEEFQEFLLEMQKQRFLHGTPSAEK